MSFLAIFVQAVQSFRLRQGPKRPRSRARIDLEQLDHRQLLAVNFTGNVATDFPVTTPAVYLTDPNNHQPQFPAPPSTLADIIKVSGFAIDQIAVNYDQATDTLSIGYLQPLNQKPGLNGIPGQFPVIAGDADNNGNNSTTDPAAAAQGVTDDPGISQTENFNAVIDLSGGTNTATESIFAGIPNNATLGYPNSTYVVAPAAFNAGTAIDSAVPVAGAELRQNEGSVFVPFNDPRHGAFEHSITHFSQLYQQVTGQQLTPNSKISIGASAGSGDDDGISEEIFHFQTFPIGNATTVPPVPPVPPPPPPPPPPVIVELFQPTILINPHENRHINTAHFTNIRVTVLGSSSFDPTQINPATVRFGGAAPIAWFSKIQLHDGIPSETFVFKGTDVNLPGGFTVAPITGQTYSGVLFSGAEMVFNRNDSFYSPAAIRSRDLRLSRLGLSVAQENAAATLASGQYTSALATQLTQAGSSGSSADLSATPAPTTVKITARQSALARAETRREALMATVAAKSFQKPLTNYAVSTPSPTASTLLTHDLALQSLTGGTAQTAT